MKNHRPSSKSSFHLSLWKWLCCYLTVLLAAPASAQIEVNPLTTWQEQTGQYLHRLKTEGDKLYGTVVKEGLVIYDIANPLRPNHLITFKGDATNPLGEVWDLEIRDGLVYLSDNTNGIVVLDVSDSANIVTLVPSFPMPAEPLGIHLVGDLLYVAVDSAGLVIVDISESRSGILKQVGQYNTPGISQDVQVVESMAYVSDSIEGIQIIDVSNPNHPTFLGGFKKERYFSAAFQDGYLYAVGRPNVLTVINVIDPTTPQLVTEYALPFSALGFSQHIELLDGAAYIPDTSDNLVVVDVRDPAQPQRTASDRWGSGPTATVIKNNHIWVGGNFGLGVAELSDPFHPAKIGVGVYTSFNPVAFESSGQLNFLRTHFRVLRILDTTIPEEPILKSVFESPEGINNFVVDGDRAYLIGNLIGNSKLTILDISDKSKLTILDISDKSNIRLLDRTLSTTNFATGSIKSFEVKDNLLIATSFGKDITIMDVSDPEQPITLLNGYQNRRLQLVTRRDHYLYGISSESKLEVYDITTPSSPQLIGTTAQTLSGSNIKIEGDHIYTWNHAGNLWISDISNPTNPVVSSTYTGRVRDVEVVGDLAYLAEDTNGVSIINISNPAEPKMVLSYPTQQAFSLTVSENILIVAGSTTNLFQIFETFGLNQATPSIVPRSFSMVAGQPQFEFRTGLPVTYSIESTTDFQTWVPAGSVTATNSRTRFSPTATSASGEFYRVRSP